MKAADLFRGETAASCRAGLAVLKLLREHNRNKGDQYLTLFLQRGQTGQAVHHAFIAGAMLQQYVEHLGHHLGPATRRERPKPSGAEITAAAVKYRDEWLLKHPGKVFPRPEGWKHLVSLYGLSERMLRELLAKDGLPSPFKR